MISCLRAHGCIVLRHRDVDERGLLLLVLVLNLLRHEVRLCLGGRCLIGRRLSDRNGLLGHRLERLALGRCHADGLVLALVLDLFSLRRRPSDADQS